MKHGGRDRQKERENISVYQCVCVCVCVCYMYAGVCGGQKVTPDLLELELQLCAAMWVLRADLESCVRTVHTHNY